MSGVVNMRVMLTGGGTGGHIYPAIAIGQAIKNAKPETTFLYVGTNSGMEHKIVPEVGFPFIPIDVVGWQRKISFQGLQAGIKAVRSLIKAQKIISTFQPDLVIGTGGYVCLPVVWAAARKKIPTYIHEQNAVPGLTNRFLAPKVDGVMLTFEASKKYFPLKIAKKLHLTGLPIRPEIMSVKRQEGLKFFDFTANKLTVLGLGGSRGAHNINQAMVTLCKKFCQDPRLQIIHLTGEKGYEDFIQRLSREGIDVGNCGNIIIKPYLNEMEYALACADLCISRAGAGFLSEMTAKGIPAILIPYPHATGNHQEYNALALVQDGAAEIIRDQELTGEVLIQRVDKILFDEQQRKVMAANSLQAGKPEAIEKILQIINVTAG